MRFGISPHDEKEAIANTTLQPGLDRILVA
jgi:hypothetical protein